MLSKQSLSRMDMRHQYGFVLYSFSLRSSLQCMLGRAVEGNLLRETRLLQTRRAATTHECRRQGWFLLCWAVPVRVSTAAQTSANEKSKYRKRASIYGLLFPLTKYSTQPRRLTVQIPREIRGPNPVLARRMDATDRPVQVRIPAKKQRAPVTIRPSKSFHIKNKNGR